MVLENRCEVNGGGRSHSCVRLACSKRSDERHTKLQARARGRRLQVAIVVLLTKFRYGLGSLRHCVLDQLTDARQTHASLHSTRSDVVFQGAMDVVICVISAHERRDTSLGV